MSVRGATLNVALRRVEERRAESTIRRCRCCGRQLFGRGSVCRSRRCPEYGPIWAGDQRQKLFRNLETLPGDILLSAVTAPGAGLLPWDAQQCAALGEHRWTLGGIRAMFSDARRVGLVDTNPFAGLRLRGSRGRKDIDIPARDEVERLAEYAVEVWSGEVALTIRALILMAAFVGMRPAELYGLRWSDIDIRADEVHVERQYSASTRRFESPKNGKTRTSVLTAPAKAGLLAMPRARGQ
jgi:integrase